MGFYIKQKEKEEWVVLKKYGPQGVCGGIAIES